MSRNISTTKANGTSEQEHEPDAIWSRMVATFGIGLLVSVLLTLLGIALAFSVFVPDAISTKAGKEWQLQNLDPGVEPNQAYGREKLQTEEETYLQQYSWEDKDRGIARIPIERAIDLLSRSKLQANWPPSESDSSPAESSSERETP